MAKLSWRTEAVIFDFDGTLAVRDETKRGPYDYEKSREDEPNHPVVWLARLLIVQMPLIIVSGRQERYRSYVEEWLAWHDIGYSRILLRPDDDERPDDEVKTDIYRAHIEPHYKVKFVVDDRQRVVDAWRALGLTCLQCAKGDF